MRPGASPVGNRSRRCRPYRPRQREPNPTPHLRGKPAVGSTPTMSRNETESGIEPIPIDWTEGPEQVTLTFWPDAPDRVVFALAREKWEKLKQQADGGLEEYITRTIVKELRSGAVYE